MCRFSSGSTSVTTNRCQRPSFSVFLLISNRGANHLPRSFTPLVTSDCRPQSCWLVYSGLSSLEHHLPDQLLEAVQVEQILGQRHLAGRIAGHDDLLERFGPDIENRPERAEGNDSPPYFHARRTPRPANRLTPSDNLMGKRDY